MAIFLIYYKIIENFAHVCSVYQYFIFKNV